MMKKLLVLSLVLAVAGLASAGLSLSYDGSKLIVSNDEPMPGGINNGIGIIGDAHISMNVGDYVLRSVGAPVAAPQLFLYDGTEALSFGLPYNGGFNTLLWGDANVDANGNIIPAPAGFWFSMPLPGYVQVEQGGSVQVDLIDGNANVLQSIQLIIPEPMTLGLLGVGALFLRKRS